MNEVVCWIVRVSDRVVVSKHIVLVMELDGDQVEVTTPDMPQAEAGHVLVMGSAADVERFIT